VASSFDDCDRDVVAFEFGELIAGGVVGADMDDVV
jgi:hypothetical protein